jgi:hypothetical protein
VDDITVEVKEEGAEHQLFSGSSFTMLDVMVIIGLALLRTGAAAAAAV